MTSAATGKRAWHALDAAATMAELATSPDGLGSLEAQARLRRHGANRLPAPPRRTVFARLAGQIHNLLIYVLLGSALIAALLGHLVDALVILAVVVINALIGFVQEGRAEDALASIRGMIDPNASVLRDGSRSTVPAEAIVPGDIVLLEAGDRVPADLRLIRARSLKLDEAALTGELVPVDKDTAAVAADAALGDRHSMAFSGTFVASGSGAGVAVGTGSATELGRISTLLGDVTQLRTPLIRQMDRLRAPDHPGHARRLRRRVPVRRCAARLCRRRRLHGRGRARGRGHPRGPARRDDHHAGHRRAPHGGTARHRPAPAGGRGAGLGHHHLLGQDRHAHPQRDDRAECRLRRAAVHGRRRRLRAGGCHRARG